MFGGHYLLMFVLCGLERFERLSATGFPATSYPLSSSKQESPSTSKKNGGENARWSTHC